VKRTCKIKSRLDSISMSSKPVGHFAARVPSTSKDRKGSGSGSGFDSHRKSSAYEVLGGNWTPNSPYY